MEVRIGELLVESGMLSSVQVAEVLRRQAETGRPFGALSEELFGVDPQQVEEAWASQYARLTRTVDPAREVFQNEATELISRRQAWQFRILPIRFDGEEIMICTTREHLRRALRFASNVIGRPVYLVMADPQVLGDALCRHYPLPGMTAKSVTGRGRERLMGMLNG